MSSHSTNSNSKRHVNNRTETNSLRPVQSTQNRQNRLSATNQYDLDVADRTTYSTRSYKQNTATRSSAQSNSNISNTHGFDFGGSSSQINETFPNVESVHYSRRSERSGIVSRAYMPHHVRRTLSGLTAEAWDRYRTRYPTQNRVPQIHTNVLEYSQIRPYWYRIVSIDVNEEESNESVSLPQPQKFQRTTYGRYQTAGVHDSHPDVEWYRKVNRDVIESQQSMSSSRSERLERRNESQHPTPLPTSSQPRSNNSRPESSVNNIRTGSQIESSLSTSVSSGSAEHQPVNVIHTTIPLQNLSSDQSPAASISTNSEHSPIQDTALFPSINMDDYPNRAQVLVDLDDFSVEDQSLIAPSISSNAGRRGPITRNIIGIIPTPQIDSTGIVEPEILEVVIRSRNSPDYSIVIADANIIQMHRVVQTSISSAGTSNSSALYQQVNDYMRVLKNTILSRDTHSSSVSSIMSASIPRMLIIDNSEYPVHENSSKMPPITTVNRIQNGKVIKELTNCAICLEEDNGNVLLEPCKHYNMCGNCMKKLKTWTCPICRSHITNIIIYI